MELETQCHASLCAYYTLIKCFLLKADMPNRSLPRNLGEGGVGPSSGCPLWVCIHALGSPPRKGIEALSLPQGGLVMECQSQRTKEGAVFPNPHSSEEDTEPDWGPGTCPRLLDRPCPVLILGAHYHVPGGFAWGRQGFSSLFCSLHLSLPSDPVPSPGSSWLAHLQVILGLSVQYYCLRRAGGHPRSTWGLDGLPQRC